MGKICCFAGHSEIYGADELYPKLVSVIEELIKNQNVKEFWAGNYGGYDKLCASAVRALKPKYPDIRLTLVVPYLTAEINEYKEMYYKNYDGILVADMPENTPKKVQILKANRYMVDNSDFLVCFVKYTFGGASKTLEYARKSKRNTSLKIINIADDY